MTEREWLNENQLSLDIWYKKYQIGNEGFEEWLDRVSGGNKDVRELIKDKKFIFGGRILASRGVTGRRVTYSNCYVITPPEDNIESIFSTAAKLARTYSYGGGCGIDISNLRPKGAIVHNAAKSTSGAVSFMDLYSQVTGLIGQAGRRGALMISIDCKHPDIEEFINLKTKQGVCEKANISIRVSDSFMEAAIHDEDWMTEFTSEETGTIIKTFKARDLLKLLAKRNWEWAEPGLLYWDRITSYNMLNNDGNFAYAGVNPCAEEPLPAGGSCLLGSINLNEFVVNPFTDKANIDWDGLEEAVSIAVLGLNQVLNEGMMLHPLHEQRESVKNWRQIGLGTMGLADMLIKLGVTYGSVGAIKITESVYETIAKTAVTASLELAKTAGCYPMCKKDKLVNSSFIQSLNLSEHILRDIETYGLHNSQLLTCAPTGSIATMLQVSTGVEPNFALKYTRKTQSLNGTDTFYEVSAKIVRDYAESGNLIESLDKLPDYFVESKDIAPIDRIKMQAVLQKYTDASISSTINLPKEATVDDVYNIYVEAWKNGLKGVTVYRNHCFREGILTTDSPKETKEIKEVSKLNNISPIHRDDIGQVLTGNTYKYHTACGTLYITINKDEEGNIVEIFTNSSKNGTCKANLNGETRLASLALRAGVKVSEVADTLKSIQCQSCAYARAKGNKIDGTSCPDIIAKCITKDMKLEKPTTKVVDSKDLCPECKSPLEHIGGCIVCPNCSWSKCD